MASQPLPPHVSSTTGVGVGVGGAGVVGFQRPRVGGGGGGGGAAGPGPSQQWQGRPASASTTDTRQSSSAVPVVCSHNNNACSIWKHRRQILSALETHQVLILVGRAGSGKSTVLPVMLYQGGWASSRQQPRNNSGRTRTIVCSQPPSRRTCTATGNSESDGDIISCANRASQLVMDSRPASGGYGYGHGHHNSNNRTASKLDDLVGLDLPFQTSNMNTNTSKTDNTSHSILYTTHHMLLRQALRDPLLLNYSVVIVDDAHERIHNVETDLLLSMLHKIRLKRPHSLKIIVCSATADEAQTFSNYFNNRNRNSKNNGNDNGSSKSMSIGPTRMPPIHHVPDKDNANHKSCDSSSRVGVIPDDVTMISIDERPQQGDDPAVDIVYSQKAVADYVKASVETALQLYLAAPIGTTTDDGAAAAAAVILCILPTVRTVQDAVRMANDCLDTMDVNENEASHRHRNNSSIQMRKRSSPSNYHPVSIVALHEQLSPRQRQQVISTASSTSTTSATLMTTTQTTILIIFVTPGMAGTVSSNNNVSHVIDCGFASPVKYLDTVSGLEVSRIAPIRQATATQRALLCCGGGTVYRLYRAQDLLSLNFASAAQTSTSTPPAISRRSLTWFVLMLKALGIQHLTEFEFVVSNDNHDKKSTGKKAGGGGGGGGGLPSTESLVHALETLYALGAIQEEEVKEDDQSKEPHDHGTTTRTGTSTSGRRTSISIISCTRLGSNMSQFPTTNIQLSKMVLSTVDLVVHIMMANDQDEEERSTSITSRSSLHRRRTMIWSRLLRDLASVAALIQIQYDNNTDNDNDESRPFSLFNKPRTPQEQMDFQHVVQQQQDGVQLLDGSGDHVTLLNVLDKFVVTANDNNEEIHTKACREHFVNPVALRRVVEMRRAFYSEIRDYLEVARQRHQHRSSSSSSLSSSNGHKNDIHSSSSTSSMVVVKSFEKSWTEHNGGDNGDDAHAFRSELIRKCLTMGHFLQVAKMEESNGQYYTLKGHRLVHIHPTSSVLGATLLGSGHSSSHYYAPYIVFTAIRSNTNTGTGGQNEGGNGGGELEVTCCSAIQAKWLPELAPHYWT
jgi:HrpA-like RNA helicase